MTRSIPPGRDAWVDLGLIGAIPPGQGRCFRVAHSMIAVFHPRSGTLRALDAVCPHQAGRLCEGVLDQEKVLCPLHGFAFLLQTGEGSGHAHSVRSYEIRITSGRILVRIPVSPLEEGSLAAEKGEQHIQSLPATRKGPRRKWQPAARGKKR
ncbi:MAG: nitrite reductase (NAD(P)H) small subunit [Methylacidiphilaceae bacterium]|nr:nitrite reductase (NAD(P)H) small subunit [Candidatus Methylacidiphilaceae bacterium]